MTAEQSVGLFLALSAMSLGLLGSILPGLPGAPLVLAAAIGHRLYFGSESISNVVLGLMVLMALGSLVLDYLASMFGAKKLGATWRGVVGAIVGALVGLFFGPLGIILGPFVGALLFELVAGRQFSDAARAGAGALLGLIIGAVGKLSLCIAMMGIFAWNVLSRSGAPLL